MSKQKGAFIAIESPLESYGARQAQLLKNKLELAGYEVVYYSFPQNGEPSSYFAERYCAGNYDLADDSMPYASSLFFALDHFEASKSIRQAVDKGVIVIAHKYLGANMVEQGSRLRHPGERRGYFMWLDNLESRVLGAVRPDKTFILTLSQEHAKNLAEDDPDLTSDTQIVKLAEQSILYAELSDVYPKDFVRIDGERNGKPLSLAKTTELLWGLMEPFLPVKEKPTQKTEESDEIALTMLADGKLPVFETSLQVTNLLETQIRSIPNLQFSINEASKNYIIPAYLDKKLTKSYKTTNDKIMAAHKQLVAKVGDQNAGLILPVATQNRLDTQMPPTALQQLIICLLGNKLPESWELGQKLLKASRDKDIAINASDVAYTASNARSLGKLSNELLPQLHASHEGETLSLSGIIPRNEHDLIAKLIYEHTNLSLKEVEQQAGKWSYDQKQTVLQAALGQRTNGSERLNSVFDDVHYSWDILADYGTFYKLQQICPNIELYLQVLTPRYGYDIPMVIDDAALSDLVESCFDASTVLHSELKAAGYELEAAYATLHGHKQRGRIVCTPNQLAIIAGSEELKNNAVIKAMLEKLAEKNSTISSAITTLAEKHL